jgi:hypothetical protein
MPQRLVDAAVAGLHTEDWLHRTCHVLVAASALPDALQLHRLALCLPRQGELDVIVDLITFVEQQQFLAVEGVHRHPASLQERLRARCLRLAANKRQLAGAGERLAAGLTALRAQALVDNRLLEDLTQLRRRWKLQRHAGAGAVCISS